MLGVNEKLGANAFGVQPISALRAQLETRVLGKHLELISISTSADEIAVIVYRGGMMLMEGEE